MAGENQYKKGTAIYKNGKWYNSLTGLEITSPVNTSTPTLGDSTQNSERMFGDSCITGYFVKTQYNNSKTDLMANPSIVKADSIRTNPLTEACENSKQFTHLVMVDTTI